jgi:NitT/TauT family transport system ATP-binding protein
MQPAGAGAPLRVDIAEKTFRAAEGLSLTALRDLSFEVRQGEFACLLGPSGCGKTTTLRILLGLDRDFSGSFQLPEGSTDRIAAVFQEPTLLPWRTVEQNVRLALPKDRRNADLDELFGSLGLSSMRTFYPSELSLGLARRAAEPSRPSRHCSFWTSPLRHSTSKPPSDCAICSSAYGRRGRQRP